MPMKISRKNIIVSIMLIIPIPLIIASLCIGPSSIADFSDSMKFLFKTVFYPGNESADNMMIRTIIFDVRMPRVLFAFIAGGALAVSGNALQSIFRNPLVSPYILGLSSGAAFGAALSLAFSFLTPGISAFIFGLTAALLSYFVAMKKKQVSIVGLILAGIIVNGIFTALLTIVQFISDPFKLQTIVHWTMGNLHNSDWDSLKSSYIFIFIGILTIYLFRWKLNVLALGDVEARTSGLNPQITKLIVLLAASIATSAVVAVAGIIGMFGLIIPHIVRMAVGNDNQISVPVNFLFGGMFLLIIDNFSRTLTSFEIPIGIFTMLLGAPFFLYLMKKSNIGWE